MFNRKYTFSSLLNQEIDWSSQAEQKTLLNQPHTHTHTYI